MYELETMTYSYVQRSAKMLVHALWFKTATVKLVYSWLAVNFPKKTSLSFNSSLPFLVSYKVKFKGHLQKSRHGL